MRDIARAAALGAVGVASGLATDEGLWRAGAGVMAVVPSPLLRVAMGAALGGGAVALGAPAALGKAVFAGAVGAAAFELMAREHLRTPVEPPPAASLAESGRPWGRDAVAAPALPAPRATYTPAALRSHWSSWWDD